MRILVTGSSGFVGQHLVPRLTADHEVYHLQSDLTHTDAVRAEVAQCRPQVIIHLAARTEVAMSFDEPQVFSAVNYAGSVNLIEAASAVPGFRMFLFASTMEVFGWQPISDQVRDQGHTSQHQVFDHNTEPHPNAPYAVAKYGVEKYLEYKHRSQAFPFAALRQTNCYGRRDNDFFVTEHIISQMLRGSTCRLGNPTPYRNFIYIDDLIAAWCSVLDHLDAVNGGIYTVGPDQPIQIRDWADLIAQEIGWQGDIKWNTKPSRAGEIYWLNSDSEALTRITGWRPVTSQQQGLAQTIETWRRRLQ